MKKIKIHVTSEHIKNGKVCLADACPIYLALEERTGDTNIRVRSDHVARITAPSDIMGVVSRRIATLPRSARRFIRKFDMGKPVQPFTFLYPAHA